ncbi:MAG TPA: phenylalanine--tRNA ligase subunit beta [Candidatus Saccharimonadales bacterium]|nr:phenylalanine--tRNA ligase subunit beta [Candidatus Saccharimonadales bacterium]
MRISVNWLKQFLDFELPPVDELVEKIGAQLGAVEEVTDLGKRYQSVSVVRVVECTKLEGSDHLNVCKIDDGGKAKDVERDSNGLVQVVCGAPNCREGLTVAWLPPGATVPASVDTDEPFVLEAREIRGQKSNGMLASPKELALYDSHEGILEIDKEVVPGTPFAEVYKLDDYIIDIENKMFTHRPDCFGALGVAREIAGITGHAFKSPDWYVANPTLPSGDGLKLTVKNELPELSPRFTAAVMTGIEVKPSPVWLQIALSKVGVKAINNVVDLTNFYMLVTGQPLHAYDYDKLKTATLGVRLSKKGEALKLLGGKQLTLEDGDIIITDGSQPVGLAGVIGGADTEVDDSTKTIALECANFDMNTVRRASMKYGLFTDASTRFTKGQSPLQNLAVIAKIIDDLQKLANGKLASPVIDDNHVKNAEQPVKVSAQFINERLGLELSAADMQKLLTNVEMAVETKGEDLTVTAPFWRTDIELPEDIVEEVGRLYGYDHLPLNLPRRDIKPAAQDELLALKQQIREKLVKSGANEVLTYSFMHGDLFDKVGQKREHAFELSNALSPDLQYYRTSLLPSLLEKIHPNLKAGFDQFALFELGKVHYVDEWDEAEPEIPNEDNHLALVVAANDKQKPAGTAYYQARKYLEQIDPTLTNELMPMTKFNLDDDEWGRQLTAPFEPNRSALIARGGMIYGVVGEFKPSVQRALKLPKYAAGFEVLKDALSVAGTEYQPLPRFPKVSQDITLKVAADQDYAEVANALEVELSKGKGNARLNVRPLGIYQARDQEGYKNLTFRIELASYERTLTDTEVNKLLDEVAAAAKTQVGAERV